MFSTEETIHAEVSVSRLQGTDDEARLIALALMLDVEPAYLIVGKEIRDSPFGADLIYLNRFAQDDQVHLLAQVAVQLLRAAFLEGHHHSYRDILRHQGGYAYPQAEQKKDYPFFHITSIYLRKGKHLLQYTIKKLYFCSLIQSKTA